MYDSSCSTFFMFDSSYKSGLNTDIFHHLTTECILWRLLAALCFCLVFKCSISFTVTCLSYFFLCVFILRCKRHCGSFKLIMAPLHWFTHQRWINWLLVPGTLQLGPIKSYPSHIQQIGSKRLWQLYTWKFNFEKVENPFG